MRFKVYYKYCHGKDNWTEEECFCLIEGNSLDEVIEKFSYEELIGPGKRNGNTVSEYVDKDRKKYPIIVSYRFEEF